MFRRLKLYLRRKRIEMYALFLKEKPLSSTDSAVIAERLAVLWRQIQPNDLLGLPPRLTALLTLESWTISIVELLERLRTVNGYIHQGVDQPLERLVAKYQERHSVTLDFYLADSKHHPIDVGVALSRLRGLLQEHYHLIKKQENQYYQRLSTKFYQDIVELTETLIYYSHDPTGSVDTT